MAYEEYQQRVVDELAALDDKLGKLRGFLRSGKAAELPHEDRRLMAVQEQHMTGYAGVLRQRIARWQ